MLSQIGEKELHEHLEKVFNRKGLDPAILFMETAQKLIQLVYDKGYADGFERGRDDYMKFPRRL